MSDSVDPPAGWDEPRWDNIPRCHDWRNHVGAELRAEWPSLSLRARILFSATLHEIAMNEEWDDVC